MRPISLDTPYLSEDEHAQAETAIENLEAQEGQRIISPAKRAELKVAFVKHRDGTQACVKRARAKGSNPLALLLRMIEDGEHKT